MEGVFLTLLCLCNSLNVNLGMNPQLRSQPRKKQDPDHITTGKLTLNKYACHLSFPLSKQ